MQNHVTVTKIAASSFLIEISDSIYIWPIGIREGIIRTLARSLKYYGISRTVFMTGESSSRYISFIDIDNYSYDAKYMTFINKVMRNVFYKDRMDQPQIVLGDDKIDKTYISELSKFKDWEDQRKIRLLKKFSGLDEEQLYSKLLLKLDEVKLNPTHTSMLTNIERYNIMRSYRLSRIINKYIIAVKFICRIKCSQLVSSQYKKNISDMIKRLDHQNEENKRRREKKKRDKRTKDNKIVNEITNRSLKNDYTSGNTNFRMNNTLNPMWIFELITNIPPHVRLKPDTS